MLRQNINEQVSEFFLNLKVQPLLDLKKNESNVKRKNKNVHISRVALGNSKVSA